MPMHWGPVSIVWHSWGLMCWKSPAHLLAERQLQGTGKGAVSELLRLQE